LPPFHLIKGLTPFLLSEARAMIGMSAFDWKSATASVYTWWYVFSKGLLHKLYNSPCIWYSLLTDVTQRI